LLSVRTAIDFGKSRLDVIRVARWRRTSAELEVSLQRLAISPLRSGEVHLFIGCQQNGAHMSTRAETPDQSRQPRRRRWRTAAALGSLTALAAGAFATYGGPYLFGAQRGMADAMFAPVATRFLTYDVKVNAPCAQYCRTIMALPEMVEWVAAACSEPDEIEELSAIDHA